METFLESEQSLEVCGVELPSGLVQGRQDRVQLPDNCLIGVPVSVHLLPGGLSSLLTEAASLDLLQQVTTPVIVYPLHLALAGISRDSLALL